MHLITKYLLPEKFGLLTSLQAEIKGGGAKKDYQPLSFDKRPSLLRIKIDKGLKVIGFIKVLIDINKVDSFGV